jgi:Zn-finger nucleic acid-binding protein
MSIKKIPICPYCKAEMKREQGSVCYNGVILPTRLTDHDPQGNRQIKDTWTFQVYICPECGFVALWRGEL